MNQLTGEVEFTVALPKDMISEGRTYYVLRMHNEVVTKLPTTINKNIIKFETDRFSTYALVYVEKIPVIDSEQPTRPIEPTIPIKPVKTNDNMSTNIWLILLGISMVSLGINRRKETK